MEKGFKFLGNKNCHNNQVDVVFHDDGKIELYCYTDGYRAVGGQYGGVFCAGGCSYFFPEIEEFEYLNVLAFIREKTWIGDDIGDYLTREEFEENLKKIDFK